MLTGCSKTIAGLVSSKDDNGATPLHYAAQNGHKEMVALLLADKADVNAKANNGETPLHFASFRGLKGVAEVLLRNKAEVNAKDDHGATPLHYAAQEGHKEVVRLLLANKADVNVKANNGATPLEIATAYEHKGVWSCRVSTAASQAQALKAGARRAAALPSRRQPFKKRRKKLHRLRYKPGPTDGVIGIKNNHSAETFQSVRGLPVTGTLDKETTELLVGQKASGGDASPSMEEIDWADTVKRYTVEAYLAFRMKYTRDPARTSSSGRGIAQVPHGQ